MSYISELIAKQVSALDVAKKYGLKVNRANRCPCPFHQGVDSNMQLFGDGKKGFYCFVCHAKGDSIALAKKILNVDYTDAVKILDKDFNLGVVGSDDAEKAWVKSRSIQEAKMAVKRYSEQDEYDNLLDLHRKYNQKLKEHPKSWENMDDGFIEALQNIDHVAYKIDCMEEEMYGK